MHFCNSFFFLLIRSKFYILHKKVVGIDTNEKHTNKWREGCKSMSPKDLFPIYLGEIFYKFQRIYFFFGILLTLYFCVCKYCNIYELLGGKWNNSIMFVKLVCTALIYSRCFFQWMVPKQLLIWIMGKVSVSRKRWGH